MRIPKTKPRSLNRRDFLKLSGICAGLSSAPFLSTLLGLQMSKSVFAATHQFSDYKALVCVFLFGGNDSFNMLTPYDTSEYNDYVDTRGVLSLPRQTLLPVSDSAGRRFGLHPGIAGLRDLYVQGNLAFLANVGTLLAPTTLSDFKNGKANIPVGLFSHSDQQAHWQSVLPQSRTQQTGWAGRMADAISDSVNGSSAVSMNIALNRVNTFQTGDVVVPYVVGTNGATVLSGYGNNSVWGRMLTDITEGLLERTYTDLLEKTHARFRRTSVDAAFEFNRALQGAEFSTEFPDTPLGSQLALVAKTIATRDSLDQSRQIFFVLLGGWDHHDDMLNRHARLLPQLSSALKAFYNATVELGVENSVTTFTASDFGRTLSSNGDGSDHGWGGNQIIMGGGVRGSQVYGDYPESLALGNLLDTGRGRLIPTTSVDEYSAELALWFGIENDSVLELILPNIRNFYASRASEKPIGFMV